MPDRQSFKPGLDSAVVRICPACGVVNPSGPATACPHLQLVRFDGVDDALGEALTELAETRHRYTELSQRLKDTVLEAVRDGRAEVETTRRARAVDFEDGFQRLDRRGLRLTHPEPPERPPDKPQPRPRRKRSGPPPVDPRQLDLLAQSPPKGDA